MSETQTRAEYEADVKRPGKFEGEAPYVPYFWGRLDEADEFDGHASMWLVSDEDRAIFPELAGTEKIFLYETSDGFVIEVSGCGFGVGVGGGTEWDSGDAPWADLMGDEDPSYD